MYICNSSNTISYAMGESHCTLQVIIFTERCNILKRGGYQKFLGNLMIYKRTKKLEITDS